MFSHSLSPASPTHSRIHHRRCSGVSRRRAHATGHVQLRRELPLCALSGGSLCTVAAARGPQRRQLTPTAAAHMPARRVSLSAHWRRRPSWCGREPCARRTGRRQPRDRKPRRWSVPTPAPRDAAVRTLPNSRAPIADLHAYPEPHRRFRRRLLLPTLAAATSDVPTTPSHLPQPRRPRTPPQTARDANQELVPNLTTGHLPPCRRTPPAAPPGLRPRQTEIRRSASLVDLTRRIPPSTTSSRPCLRLVDDPRAQQCRWLDLLV